MRNGHLSTPTRRVILLGASNLTRSFSSIVSTLRRTWGMPLEIMAALGHGRSYGQDSTFLGRKIPGIFPCALWHDLQCRPPLPTVALMTDIGNDLMYGVPVSELLEWIAACLDRLASVGASTVVTQLPLESIARLSEARFRFFRRLFFPNNALTLTEARSLARLFNEQLVQLGDSRKIPIIPVSSAWFGVDPIHLKRRKWHEAWPTLLAPWQTNGAPIEFALPSPWTAAYLATLAPREYSRWGIRRCVAQPSGHLSDGTTISLY